MGVPQSMQVTPCILLSLANIWFEIGKLSGNDEPYETMVNYLSRAEWHHTHTLHVRGNTNFKYRADKQRDKFVSPTKSTRRLINTKENCQ